MRRSVLFPSLVLLLASCEATGPAGTAPPSFLRAEITGAVELDYEGSGDFWTGGSSEARQPPTFGINSRGQGSAEGQSFSLWRQSEGRPPRGSYALSAPEYSRERWSDFAAVYHREGEERMEAFVARSGAVHITRSDPDRIEGSFEFSGVRYCARSLSGRPWMEGSCTPDDVDPGAPALRISGSFVAVPASYEATPRIGR